MLPVKLAGIVTKYKGNGRKFGYPTANIAATTKLPDGVYFGRASLDKYIDQPALIFIGVPTTVGDRDRRVEAYLMDIEDKDYYGQALRLEIQSFHRSNQKFASIDELIEVMHQDETEARSWFKASSDTAQT